MLVNLCSGKQLWQPPALDWDIEWDIVFSPNPEDVWYRVSGSHRWVHLDYINITSWIHLPTGYHWYLVEDTARPISARLSLPHQIELILAKLTLRWMILTKRGGVAMPVESDRSLSLESHPSSPYVLCGCHIVSDKGGLPAVIASPSVDNG